MTTAATSMTTMRPGDLDELQDGEPLRRAPRSSAMRDAAREVLGISRMHVSRLTPSRVGARVSARARPEGSAR
jgi:hypothetical protein